MRLDPPAVEKMLPRPSANCNLLVAWHLALGVGGDRATTLWEGHQGDLFESERCEGWSFRLMDPPAGSQSHVSSSERLSIHDPAVSVAGPLCGDRATTLWVGATKA